MKNVSFELLSANHLKFIYSVSQEMADNTDEHQVLQTILQNLIQFTHAEVGAFIFYDKARDAFDVRMKLTSLPIPDETSFFSQSVFRQVVESRESVLVFDTRTDDTFTSTQSVVLNNIHAILAFPLIVRNDVYGILYFDSRESRQNFTEESRQLLSLFTPIASLSLEHVLTWQKIRKENTLLKSKIEDTPPLPEIVGQSDEMQNLSRLVHKVAASDISVLIQGENGTGKDLIAKAIHTLGKRSEQPFIAQYVGNIPSSILESELFGYKKGAFTGANQDKMGLFEALDHGTLFLDEIGDLPMELQTKLLRVLENKEIKRVGENFIRKVDVRIIAATNRDLQQLIDEGKFREDLYYRLNVVNIRVPPLRERRSDIPLLIEHFLNKYSPDEKMSFSPAALKKAMLYSWPGNVRQLENIIQRAVVLSEVKLIDADDIFIENTNSNFSGTMEEFKKHIIRVRLKEFGGNKTQAAKSLNISLRSLQQHTKEMGL